MTLRHLRRSVPLSVRKLESNKLYSCTLRRYIIQEGLRRDRGGSNVYLVIPCIEINSLVYKNKALME